jgi:hypothetical protein
MPRFVETIPDKGTCGRFDRSLRCVMRVVTNHELTIVYEKKWRWTVMGLSRCEWIVFEMVSTNAFKISLPLQGDIFVRCRLEAAHLEKRIVDGIRQLSELARARAAQKHIPVDKPIPALPVRTDFIWEGPH